MVPSLESLEVCWGELPGDDGPWFAEVRGLPEPSRCFAAVGGGRHCLFLDSSLKHRVLGGYSFLAIEPQEFRQFEVGSADPLGELRRWWGERRAATVPGLPPFQGGLAGLWSYDLNRSYEQIAATAWQDLTLPAIAVGIYSTVMSWDHHDQDRCWIVAHGYPEQEPAARRERARGDIQRMVETLVAGLSRPLMSEAENGAGRERRSLEELARSYPVAAYEGVLSNFTQEGYLDAVGRGIEHILAGDVFQVNLSHRLLARAGCGSQELYLDLRSRNPATFSAYFDLGDAQILSASPERLVQVSGRLVETRPIKGTTRRTRFPEADLAAAVDLGASEKDRAENIMIVDLLRNDLSRVCEPDSIQVTQLCQVEQYQYVQHLVSAIQGELRVECDPFELLKAVFPGGSITGAPKIRAEQIIADIEPTPRGAYCGSLGYIGFDQTCDLNILIRTITAQAGWWSFPVGGGIVVQSDPQREWVETWQKARGLLDPVIRHLG